MEYITLNNGVEMPALGYGVFKVTAEECERCVLDALDAGYRSIDTAQAYWNEAEVGTALKKSGIPREEIFLTTKVWISNFAEGKCRESVLKSMEMLQTDYLDLLLLHQPVGDVYGAWRDLESLYEEGLVRAIGVSNFAPERIVDFARTQKIVPAINQVETHPASHQLELMKWMNKYGVKMEAWGPLGQGRKAILNNPVLIEIGNQYGKTAAQVALRWNIQRGVVVIPKSTHIERMKENFDIFDFKLNKDDMGKIAKLDTTHGFSFELNSPEKVERLIDM